MTAGPTARQGGPSLDAAQQLLAELPPSAAAGEELGEVEVLVNGQRVGESPLVAQEGYEEASLWDRISYTAGGLLERAQEAVTGLFV